MRHLLVTSAFAFALTVLPPALQAQNLSAANMAQLDAAIKSARPGDTIVMLNGKWADAVIDVNVDATSRKPVTIMAMTPGKVVLTGKSRLRLNSPHVRVEGLYFRDGMSVDGEAVIQFRSNECRVANTAIVDFNPVDGRISYPWVYFDGSDNVLDQSLFEGKNNPGPVVMNGCCDARRNRITNSYFKDIKYVAEDGREIIQVHGIGGDDQFTRDGAYFSIDKNLFERADGEGAEIISIKSNFNVIRHNPIRASRGGITLRSGYANTIENNFIFGDGKAGANGIRLQGHQHRVVNNYIQGVANGLQLHTGERLFSRGCIADYFTVDFLPFKKPEAPCGYVVRYSQVRESIFAHNTFINTSNIDIFVGIGYKNRWPYEQMVLIPEDNLFAYNLIYKSVEGTAVVTQRPDLSPPLDRISFKPNRFLRNMVFGGELLINKPSLSLGFIIADPKLRYVDGMYRLATDSPAIDRAVVRAGRDRKTNSEIHVSHDIEGQSRFRPDIGADEVSHDRVYHPPLAPADVGPAWLKQGVK